MSRFPHDAKVYVGDLGSNASKQEIEEAFGYYGSLRSVWVARNPPGFAFVEFDDARWVDGNLLKWKCFNDNLFAYYLLVTLKIQFADSMDEPSAEDVRASNFQPGKQLEVTEVAQVEEEEATELVVAALEVVKTVATNAETEDISLVIADVEDVAGNFHRLLCFSRGNKHSTGCCVTNHDPYVARQSTHLRQCPIKPRVPREIRFIPWSARTLKQAHRRLFRFYR